MFNPLNIVSNISKKNRIMIDKKNIKIKIEILKLYLLLLDIFKFLYKVDLEKLNDKDAKDIPIVGIKEISNAIGKPWYPGIKTTKINAPIIIGNANIIHLDLLFKK